MFGQSIVALGAMAYRRMAPSDLPCPGLRFARGTVYFLDANGILRLLDGRAAFSDVGGQRESIAALIANGQNAASVTHGSPACSGLQFVDVLWDFDEVFRAWVPGTRRVEEPAGLPLPAYIWPPSGPRNAPYRSPWECNEPPGGGNTSGSAGSENTPWGPQPKRTASGGGDTAGSSAGGSSPWDSGPSASAPPPQPK